MTVAGQSAVNYTYDDAIAQGSSTAAFTYDSAGRRTSLTLPNAMTTTYAYDAASDLTGLSYQLGATKLGDLGYEYDLVGRRASVGGSFARTGLPTAQGWATYNANNQLTQRGSTSFAYDGNGNLTSDGGQHLHMEREKSAGVHQWRRSRQFPVRSVRATRDEIRGRIECGVFV